MARCAGAVRYARCGEPKQGWPSTEHCLDTVTGERLEIERLTSRFERGVGKGQKGTSLAAYPTARTVLEQRWMERSAHRL